MAFPVTNGVTTFIPPPPGVVPDFDHPQQQKWLEHYLVFAIGAPLAFLALCQRYYTKVYLSNGLQIDDCECCVLQLFGLQERSADCCSFYVSWLGRPLTVWCIGCS